MFVTIMFFSWLHGVVADYRGLPRDIVELAKTGARDQANRKKLKAWVASNTP